ncbi:MAG: hypothetical protein A4E30_00238 [Methanomassiliicoccales archaeon PtaB.Bin215]|nr:MAG: hypothetical protein A4E30_00238 [Methanomassiliicoccales archaeon PtaB.Bin215]
MPKYLDKAELEVKEGKASEYAFAVRKAETTGKYGKPAEYWQAFNDAIASGRAKSFKKPMGAEQKDAWEIDLTVYRVPNPQICDLAHTLSAMAQKRAAVLGTRWAVPGLTDIFEVNERVEAGEVVIDGEYSYVTEQEKAEERVRLERAMHGSGKPYDPTHDHRQDIAELYGDAGNGGSSEAKSGNGNGKKLAPADEIRKRFGEAGTGKDVPPSDADFKAMLSRIEGLKIDAEKLATFLFNTPPGGLSEAHVRAIMSASDEQLKKVLV